MAAPPTVGRTIEDRTALTQPQQTAIEWAGVVLVRARAMADAPDDVNTVVAAAMDATGPFRNKLIEQLVAEGRNATDAAAFAASVQSAISAMAREYILRTRARDHRPTPPQRPADERQPRDERAIRT